MARRFRTPLLLDLLSGAAAGAVGTYLMTPSQKMVQMRQSGEDKKAEKENALEKNATEMTAIKLAKPFGVKLEGKGLKKASYAVHWLYGISWGIGYALLSRRFRGAPVIAGILFGSALWFFGDELAVPTLGLAPTAERFPVSTHLKALSAHLGYGLGVDVVHRAANRAIAAATA